MDVNNGSSPTRVRIVGVAKLVRNLCLFILLIAISVLVAFNHPLAPLSLRKYP